MPRFSVFTPSHNPRWLGECFESLASQTIKDWEWIVVLNRGAQWTPPPGYPVVVIDAHRDLGVGEAKRLACDGASGEILVELDNDTVLASDALECIGDAFDSNPQAVLVYSHGGQILEGGSNDDSRVSADAGQEFREGDIDGRGITPAVSMAATPHNVSCIWFAPHHVRAFRASAYAAAGGYDAGLDILEDQDLMARLYLLGEFAQIDRCLHLQRTHHATTHRDAEINARIQRETGALYDKYFERAALAWAGRGSLLALEARRDGALTSGYRALCTAADPEASVWDTRHLADNSVGVIRAQESMTMASDPVGLFDELYRILAPGGIVITVTPSSEGGAGFQDPLARSCWNENSFWYATDDTYRDRVPGPSARVQTSRSVTTFPSEWHETRQLSYAFVNLIAIKEGVPRNGGRLLTGFDTADDRQR